MHVGRAVAALALAAVCAVLLLATLFVSSEVRGRYAWAEEFVRLVAAEGELYAFEPGQHPEIDGHRYTDPEQAAAAAELRRQTGAHSSLFDRVAAAPVIYSDPGHRWTESVDTVEFEAVPLEVEGVSVPWLRLVTVRYECANEVGLRRHAGASMFWPTGPSHPAVAYLREHAPWSEIGDRLAEGVHTYPRVEIEPRFLWMPIAQLVLLVTGSISIWVAGMAIFGPLVHRLGRGAAAPVEAPTSATPEDAAGPG